MSTWAAHAAPHASLTLRIDAGPMPAFNSASLYWFALGTSATVLAFVVMRSPRPLNRPGHLASLWSRLSGLAPGRRPSRPSRPRPHAPISARSRFRQRVDLMLLRMLGDDLDEHSESCPAASGATGETRPGRPAPSPAPAAKSRRRKHRLAEPPKQPLKESRGRKRAPRHAAPPAAAPPGNSSQPAA